jgi:precorrin-6Y C5,15-methyltransferase (decarboxylating)
MTHPIDVIGIGADGLAGLRPQLVARIKQSDFLAGGERHLTMVGPSSGAQYVIRNNLDSLVNELGNRRQTDRCVVLASGDPLFYGVGATLLAHHWLHPLRIEPALSSMQLAFARAGIAWQDAELASVHGRDLRTTLLPLLGRWKIGLFTQDGDGPAEVARFFLERGPRSYVAIVCENLGSAGEHVTHWRDLAQLAEQRFAPLNYLVLRRIHPSRLVVPLSWNDASYCWSATLPEPLPPEEEEMRRWRSLAPGVPDEAFERPEDGREVMTRQEVRAVTLGKLLGRLDPGDVVWDIGAGLGTVAVEAAVLRPAVEVLAVERDPVRAAYLRKNRDNFEAFNLRVIEGDAPEALADEPIAPRAVFIGGSGTKLPAILEDVTRRLQPEGRLVANFVTLEHLLLTLARLKTWDWPYEITEVQVSRSDGLAGLTGLKPQRGVFIVSTSKRGLSRE